MIEASIDCPFQRILGNDLLACVRDPSHAAESNRGTRLQADEDRTVHLTWTGVEQDR